MESLQTILAFIGTAALGGGVLVTVVYQAFKHFAAKWLDARFDERLQSLKHGHDQEIESLRFRIASLLDRTVKLHQREFDVLPEAWGKLNDAYWYVKSFISPMQSYPDLDAMGPLQLEEFIASCTLLEWQKVEIRQTSKERTALYIKQIFWHKLAEAQNQCRDGYTYLMKNGIFIDREIYKQLLEIHDLVWNALIEHKINEESKNAVDNHDHISKMRTRGDELMRDIERQIHQRLWSADLTVWEKKGGG